MSLEDTIKKAQETAAQAVEQPVIQQVQQQQQPAPYQQHAPAQYAPSSPITVDEAVNSSVAVDFWLKVAPGTVNVDGNTYAEIPVIIAPADASLGGSIGAFIGLNYGNDQDTKYSKTYGRVTVDDGEGLGMSWADHVAQVQLTHPSAKPFNGYQLILEVAEEVKDIKGGNPLPKGTLLGYSTSKTSANEVAKFVRKLKAAGAWGEPEDKRLVAVGGLAKEATINGKKVNWSVITLLDKGEYVDPDDVA